MNAHSLARTTPLSRAVLIGRVVKEGRTIAQTAAAFGVSTRTVYKWMARYRLEGAAGLRDRPSRPHRSPGKVSGEREELILRLRRSRQTSPQIEGFTCPQRR